MSEHNINVGAGQKIRLPTAGKYCSKDIVVTAEGATPMLYGSYVMTYEPELSDTRLYEDFNGKEVLGFFSVDGFRAQLNIQEFICDTGGYYIYNHEYNSTIIYDNRDGHYGWRFTDQGAEAYNYGPSYRVIEFREPVEVSLEFYNQFMKLVKHADYAARDVGYEDGYGEGFEWGYEVGYEQGYDAGVNNNQEIVSELMEWGVLTESTLCTVVVYNYHPTKRLKATLYVLNQIGEEWEQEIDLENLGNDTYLFESESQGLDQWDVTIYGVRFE